MTRRGQRTERRQGRWFLASVGVRAAAALLLLTLCLAAPVPAATFTVNNTADVVDVAPGDGVCETVPGNGVCTLRAAVQEANALAGADTIDLPAGTYTFSLAGSDNNAAAGDLDITGSLILQGAGFAATIVDAAGLDRVFDPIAGVSVTLSGLTIQNGSAGGQVGGGLRNAGALTLVNVSLSNNSAKEGGGIYSLSTSSLSLTNVSVTGNTALDNGGGIWIKDSAVGAQLENVTLSGNSVTKIGGGIYVEATVLSVTKSTLSGNSSGDEGGGLWVKNSPTTLTNVTFSGNTAVDGAGLINYGNMVDLINVTFSGNSATGNGGAIRNNASGTLNVTNTLVANSASGGNCSGTITDGGFNLSDDATCGTIPAILTGLDPTLADNGGPTLTHKLLAGSNALDTGTNTRCPVTDQRGYARPYNVQCDMGAYEESPTDVVIDGDFSEWDDGEGNEMCLDDAGGADDWTNPHRADITKFCIASDQTDTLQLLFGFDDVTLSGGNKATACVLVDTDDPANGNMDKVVCTTLRGPGATTVDAVELYDCDDTLVDGCGAASLLRTYSGGDYGFSNTAIGPFGNADSFLELALPYSDLGASGGQLVFSSLISYQAASLLTSPKDSIFGTSAQDYDARIEYDLDSGTARQFLLSPVTLSWFRSTGGRGRVVFEWSTATEVGNLGFHLHALEGEELRRLDAELIGSRVGDSLLPQRYAYEAATSARQFFLEDVDIFGTSEFHGPFSLGKAYGDFAPAPAAIDWGAIRQGSAQLRRRAASRPGGLVAAGPSKLGLGAAVGFERSGLRPFTSRLGQAGAVLRVERDGVYRVTYEELVAAGVDLQGVAAADLALTSQGLPVPLRIEGPPWLGPGSFVEFVGEALETLYTHTNVYHLKVDRKQALRVARDARPPAPWARVPEVYTETSVVERDRSYLNVSPSEDPWWDRRLLATSKPVSTSLDLELEGHVLGTGPVELEVSLWGVTDFPQSPDHHVVLEVNGVEVADEWFDGQVDYPIAVELSDSLLESEGNTLRIALPHDTGVPFDLVHYNHYRVSYPRAFVARDGRLTFGGAAEAYRVEGLPSGEVVVYRVDGDGTTWATGVETRWTPAGFEATFVGSGREATYHVVAVGALERAAIEPARKAGELPRGAVELLVISHPDFVDGLAPLIATRRSEGWSVAVVDVEDLYARFSHGIFTPEAIRAYVRYAAEELGTRHVLLVGGDTYDYLDHLGLGSVSFIPSLYTRTGPFVRHAPVDPLFGDVDGDDVPDLAVGRLPVRTPAELAVVIDKLLDYRGTAAGRSAVVAADAVDLSTGYSFREASEAMAAMLKGWQVERAYLDDQGVAAARTKLIDEIERGVALTSYFGHSGARVWSFEGLFHADDAAALTNAGRPTVVTQWGCWNTYHVTPAYNTLAHHLLLNPDGGAATVLGGATLTRAEPEERLGRLLFAQLAEPGISLGEALTRAKQQLAKTQPEARDVLLGWTLLGDPTLVVDR